MYCTDELSVSIFETLKFSFFSPNVPVLVYYSHLTAIVACLFLSFFIIHHNRKLLSAKILVAISVIFSLWSAGDILLWTQIDSSIIMLIWSLWFSVFTTIFLLSFYFLYAFIKQKDASMPWKIFFTVPALLVLLLSPTAYNLSGFNLADCSAIENSLMINLVYILTSLIFLSICIFGIREFKKATDSISRRRIAFSTIGIVLFLTCFSIATYIASIANLFNAEPDTFTIEQYGYFGMTIFIAFLTYSIVKYKAFNVKLLAAQALVATLILLIGSQFFFIRNPVSLVLNGITFALSTIFGLLLVKSVQREIHTREQLERLADELQRANAGQETFIHFLSHEMKGYFSVARNAFSAIIEGDYGPVSPELTAMAGTALQRTSDGVDTVENILKSANLKSGKVAYTMKPFDIGNSIIAVIKAMEQNIKARRLTLQAKVAEGPDYIINGDQENLTRHVIRNLIDNAINYTPSGNIEVELVRKDSSVLLSIKDSGVGINAEDKKRLFTEGGRGKDATKVNAHSTGHGLFIAKNIVDAHKGKIWAESEGDGKGTTFYVELPVK